MFIDALMSTPDISLLQHNASHILDNVTVLADDPVRIGGNGSDAPKLNIQFDKGITRTIRIIAIALAIAWALFLIYNLGKPGGSRQAVQKMGGPVGLIAALTAIVGGLDINMTMSVIDKMLQVGWFVLNTLKNAF